MPKTRKSMPKTSSNTQRKVRTVHDEHVPDQVVSQVGKAVAQIMKLRQSYVDVVTTAESEAERQQLAHQIEDAAARAINDQGLTVDQYNHVIAATQADAELEERVMVAYRTA
jgi:hypothetical protein